MSHVMINGFPVQNSRDIVYTLNLFGVPGVIVARIEEMLDESARLERAAKAKNNSDMSSYEISLEGYGGAMDDIKDILETFEGGARLNRDKVIAAFNDIKKLIDNVH